MRWAFTTTDVSPSQARLGKVDPGVARRGMAWIGTAGQGTEQRAGAQQGSIPCRCLPFHGGKARLAQAWSGLAGHGPVWRGDARRGDARRGKGCEGSTEGLRSLPAALTGAAVAGHGQAEQDMAGLGGARCGLAWTATEGLLWGGSTPSCRLPFGARGSAWHGKARPGTAVHGSAGPGKPAAGAQGGSIPPAGLALYGGLGARPCMAWRGKARRGNAWPGMARQRRAGAERGSIPRRRLAPSGAHGSARLA